MIVETLKPPYYAVIFSSVLKKESDEYNAMAKKMEQLARQQKGFLGIESSRTSIGITVSYWKDEHSILAWKNNIEHQTAQQLGREKWYQKYQLRICKVERAYGFGHQL